MPLMYCHPIWSSSLWSSVSLLQLATLKSTFLASSSNHLKCLFSNRSGWGETAAASSSCSLLIFDSFRASTSTRRIAVLDALHIRVHCSSCILSGVNALSWCQGRWTCDSDIDRMGKMQRIWGFASHRKRCCSQERICLCSRCLEFVSGPNGDSKARSESEI